MSLNNQFGIRLRRAVGEIISLGQRKLCISHHFAWLHYPLAARKRFKLMTIKSSLQVSEGGSSLLMSTLCLDINSSMTKIAAIGSSVRLAGEGVTQQTND
eukprot:s4057_g4.t1